MTNEEYINQIIEIGNTLQIHPNSPKGQTLKKCIELLSAVPEKEKGEWIPISERLPEMGIYVLCACQANIYDVFKLTPEGWFHDVKHTYMFGFVRAWQPLPEPYKAESKAKPNESLIKDCCEAQGHLWADNNIFEGVEWNTNSQSNQSSFQHPRKKMPGMNFSINTI